MNCLSLLILLSLLTIHATAQAEESDPMNFFPHQVGDTWVYLRPGNTIDTRTITAVEQKEDKSILIYYNNIAEPAYKIDSACNVFFYPQTFPYHLEYKLTAEKGEQWLVSRGTGTNIVAWAVDKYETYIFGRPSTVMVVDYYETPAPDTIVTDQSAYWYRFYLASGFGFIRHTGEAGDIWVDLLGCIINGDTLGTITDVKEGVAGSSFLVSVSPNPCTAFTTIRCHLPLGMPATHLELINLYGSVLYSTQLQTDSYTLNTSILPNGIYFCRVTAGAYTTTQQIIIHK